MLKTVLLAATFAPMAGGAHAAIPFFNATCPTDIEVHADEGGPIYINGKEAKLKTYGANAYDAMHGHVTISLTINPDGSPSVSYTRQGGANGICTVAAEKVHGGGNAHHGQKTHACPPDVSEADRYRYPGCN